MIIPSLPPAALPEIPSDLPAFTLNAGGKVTSWNAACARLTGITAREILNTGEQWRAFYLSPPPRLADFILSGRIEELRREYPTTLRQGASGEASCLLHIERTLEGESSIWTQAGLLRDASGDAVGAYQIFQTVSLTQIAAFSPLSRRSSTNSLCRSLWYSNRKSWPLTWPMRSLRGTIPPRKCSACP